MKNFRWLCVVLALVVVFSLFSVGQAAPKQITLQIIDVAGSKQMVGAAVDAFAAQNHNVKIDYVIGTSPELPAKIKAQQMAGNVETCVVFTGYDAMGSGSVQHIWEQILPEQKKYFPGLEKNYLPAAKKAYDLFGGYGIVFAWCPGGPMFTYNPDKVKNVPKTAAQLLEWCKANPGKFMYARPANSGPGRAFLMGLPYILGDKNPKDPKTWDKTWAYLKELDQYIDYYPSGTGITFREMGEGTRDILASHLGWDVNQRILGTIPANSQAFFLEGTTWVNDSHFACMPKGLDKEHKAIALKLIAWLLKPSMQAYNYDTGYFYPGPAVKNVPLSMAPAESRTKLKAAERKYLDEAVTKYPSTTQLDAEALTTADDMWDRLVGAKTKK
ncbi:MAG TPA: ABC transporter substrate-binding protein [Firmicutes bacterium]|jgi:putative spermidine/putrescine transport system substrate-binding protein|nr:ABC transporter substrate-binding protein [Bacillota bacterium]